MYLVDGCDLETFQAISLCLIAKRRTYYLWVDVRQIWIQLTKALEHNGILFRSYAIFYTSWFNVRAVVPIVIFQSLISAFVIFISELNSQALRSMCINFACIKLLSMFPCTQMSIGQITKQRVYTA